MRRTSWIDQRINDGLELLWILLRFDVEFFWRRRIGRWRMTAIMAKASITSENVADPPMPGSALVVIESELVFRGLKTVSIAHLWPSITTSVSMDVPAGHQW